MVRSSSSRTENSSTDGQAGSPPPQLATGIDSRSLFPIPTFTNNSPGSGLSSNGNTGHNIGGSERNLYQGTTLYPTAGNRMSNTVGYLPYLDPSFPGTSESTTAAVIREDAELASSLSGIPRPQWLRDPYSGYADMIDWQTRRPTPMPSMSQSFQATLSSLRDEIENAHIHHIETQHESQTHPGFSQIQRGTRFPSPGSSMEAMSGSGRRSKSPRVGLMQAQRLRRSRFQARHDRYDRTGFDENELVQSLSTGTERNVRPPPNLDDQLQPRSNDGSNSTPAEQEDPKPNYQTIRVSWPLPEPSPHNRSSRRSIQHNNPARLSEAEMRQIEALCARMAGYLDDDDDDSEDDTHHQVPSISVRSPSPALVGTEEDIGKQNFPDDDDDDDEETAVDTDSVEAQDGSHQGDVDDELTPRFDASAVMDAHRAMERASRRPRLDVQNRDPLARGFFFISRHSDYTPSRCRRRRIDGRWSRTRDSGPPRRLPAGHAFSPSSPVEEEEREDAE